jgi:tRNA G18 (ribose-2'-O)-methylase SpoU
VGPWPGAWPEDPRYDPALLAGGDARNVIDRYRYWTVEAITADVDARRAPLHVAIENWEHDLNIGSIVRTANAFAVAEVHIVGRRRWNRRGAMVTDRYLRVRHHPDVGDLTAWAARAGIVILGIDNVPGAEPLEGRDLPERCAMLFGSEGAGLSAEALAACAGVLEITQHGSTRSLNAGAAAAIAMWAWTVQHRRGRG